MNLYSSIVEWLGLALLGVSGAIVFAHILMLPPFGLWSVMVFTTCLIVRKSYVEWKEHMMLIEAALDYVEKHKKPNRETQDAMEDTRNGNVNKVENAEHLFRELNKEDKE